MPEATLLQRIARGDQSAVPECLSRYGGLVWSLALRLGGPGRVEAEDAAQEVFLDLWRNAGRFDPLLAAEETFVAMIARRRLIDRRRKLGRRIEPDRLTGDLAGPVAADPLEIRDEADRAAAALAGLDESRRRVLTLAIYHGMTYEEIARATGHPLGTVKTLARRALIELRRRLGKGEPAAGREGALP